MTEADFDTTTPRSESYLRLQSEKVLERLSATLEGWTPDVVLVGNEVFSWGLPQLADAHGAASAIVIHRAIRSLPDGPYPEALRDRFAAELARASLLICCAEHLSVSFRVASFTRVLTVPNGVDTARFRPHPKDPDLFWEFGLAEDATIAAHVSNLKSVKRPLDLIVSAKAVFERVPDYRCLMIGDTLFREEVQRACHEQRVADAFQFAGWVEQREMPRLLSSCDLVVMPSAREGVCLACLEAMACARLVVASDILGMREIITDGETGLLFRMGDDVDDLAEKTLRAVRDAELRARIGRAAGAYVERHHRLDVMIARYEAVLLDLVGRRQPSEGRR